MVPGGREDAALLYRLDDPKAAAPLFAGWEETMLWSCLSGVMGEIYAAAPEAPSSAAAVLGSSKSIPLPMEEPMRPEE